MRNLKTQESQVPSPSYLVYSKNRHGSVAKTQSSGSLLPTILRHQEKAPDLFNESHTYLRTKIMRDEQNDINFYDIPEIDKLKQKKRFNNTAYKSIHSINDLALTRGCKFFKPKPMNEIEQRERNHLKQNGNLLLLGEMYFIASNSLSSWSNANFLFFFLDFCCQRYLFTCLEHTHTLSNILDIHTVTSNWRKTLKQSSRSPTRRRWRTKR